MRLTSKVVWAAILVCALLPMTAQAQGHPCDTIPVSLTTVRVGEPFTLAWCVDSKDTNGNPTTITGYKLLRNTGIDTGNFITDPVPNAAGLYYVHVSRTERVVGTVTYAIAATNAQGDSVSVPFPPLSVLSALTAPTAPTRQRIIP